MACRMDGMRQDIELGIRKVPKGGPGGGLDEGRVSTGAARHRELKGSARSSPSTRACEARTALISVRSRKGKATQRAGRTSCRAK